MFKNRSKKLELMDDLDFGDPVVFQTLKELKFINKWLGGNQVSLRGLEKLLSTQNNKTNNFTIADLGSGGGDMMVVMSNWANKRGYKCSFIGIDANRAIVEYATENTSAESNINHQHLDIFSEEFSSLEFDIVTCTLFTHHFSDEDLITMFNSLKNQVNIGIVINDLHRHWLAYYSIKWLTRLFSRSYMVKYDAPLSVARSFRKKDWAHIFRSAGIRNYDLKWKWAFRWQIVIPPQPNYQSSSNDNKV